jgi:ABC-type multidrug transport system ATPase subunit
VHVHFGPQVALDGVSLEAVGGQVTSVVGGDGAGKSTLLRVLAGALAPGAGIVRRPSAYAIGYLPAGSGTYPDLSVGENIAFSLSAYGIRPAQARQSVDSYLELTGLAGARDRLAGHLSGGMRQKLGVVRAMLHHPELLVLDEPTTGVDPVSRADLWWLIARAAADGAAVVFATTYLDEAERASSVLMLDSGRTLAQGTADEVIAEVRDAARSVPSRPRGPVAAAAPLAEATGATRSFGRVRAVDSVDLEVHAGEVVGLLGANGAGKTTLIRLLLGLLEASSGDVRLFGAMPSRQTRRQLGYVPQGLGLYDDLTPGENLAFQRAVFTGTAKGATSLDKFPDTPVGQLSLGVQRQTAFALALDHHPALLVLDEPTSGVGPLGRAGLWETIRSATEAGAGALVTTHNMEEAVECDRLVVMAEGKVVAQGSVQEIVGDARAIVVDTDDWSRAFDLLQAAGARVALVGRSLRAPAASAGELKRALGPMRARFREVPATLEESFLQLATGGLSEPGER